jgi:hypothetical protein
VPNAKLVPLALLVLVLAACGGGGGGGTAPKVEGNPEKGGVDELAVGDCLSGRGYPLQPVARGVSARSPRAVPFTVAFFKSAALARTVARAKSGASAIENAVVTPTSARALSAKELATIRACIDRSRS